MIKKKARKNLYLTKEEFEKVKGKSVFFWQKRDEIWILSIEETKVLEEKFISGLRGKKKREMERMFFSRTEEVVIASQKTRVPYFLLEKALKRASR